ncbi:MAG: hypothetical protein ACREIF_16175 [Chthoniobacterales bacterium]
MLLLVRGKEWADLRERAVLHGFHFLHRLPADAFNLRRGLVDDRLHLGLLIRREIQVLGHLLE